MSARAPLIRPSQRPPITNRCLRLSARLSAHLARRSRSPHNHTTGPAPRRRDNPTAGVILAPRSRAPADARITSTTPFCRSACGARVQQGQPISRRGGPLLLGRRLDLGCPRLCARGAKYKARNAIWPVLLRRRGGTYPGTIVLVNCATASTVRTPRNTPSFIRDLRQSGMVLFKIRCHGRLAGPDRARWRSRTWCDLGPPRSLTLRSRDAHATRARKYRCAKIVPSMFHERDDAAGRYRPLIRPGTERRSLRAMLAAGPRRLRAGLDFSTAIPILGTGTDGRNDRTNLADLCARRPGLGIRITCATSNDRSLCPADSESKRVFFILG